MNRHIRLASCRVALFFACSGTLSASLFGQGSDGVSPEAELAAALQAKLDSVGVMGFAASVIVDKRVVWKRGFGYADWKRTIPFSVASVSKPFVGVAMMQAVEAGKLNLDEDINRYLPFKASSPHRPGAKITLRHLATHTSGITDRWEAYRKTYDFSGSPKQTLSDYLRNYFVPGGKEYSKSNFLEANPGEERDYSNIGASLAGYIVERATGKPLNESTRTDIFGLLGIARSGWFLREIAGKNLSDQFASQNGLTFPIRTYSFVTYPDGGLRATVSDLSNFYIAMLDQGAWAGRRILSQDSAREMQRFQFAADSRPKNVPEDQGNSGLFWRTKMNGTRIGHGGSDPGVAAEMMASLDRSIGVAFISNTSVSGADGVVFNEILDVLWKFGEAKKRAKVSSTF